MHLTAAGGNAYVCNAPVCFGSRQLSARPELSLHKSAIAVQPQPMTAAGTGRCKIATGCGQAEQLPC